MHAAHADDDEADSDGAKCCSCWWYADSDAGEQMSWLVDELIRRSKCDMDSIMSIQTGGIQALRDIQ